jgi:YD repeat-containing protein
LSGGGKQVTDPKGNVTPTYYQAFDEPAYKDPIRVSAPGGITQTIARDLYGNPTSITQSGAYGSENDSVTKTLLYDSYHRLCRTTEPESGSTVMAYDAANNLQWSAQGQTITDGTCGQSEVAASAQTVRTYDAMNRVLSITPPAGTQSTTYTYDAVGNVKTAVSGVTTQSFNYNTRNLLSSQTLSVTAAGASSTWGIGYSYDAYAHLSAIGYPASGGASEGLAYSPDALGRATEVGSYASGITYFPNGQVAGFNYGNGDSYVAQQNARQLLSNFSYGASSLKISEDYSYDADGNITHVNDLVNGQRSKTFGYDALNRLISATASNLYGTENYTYDALNNLRTRLAGGNTLSFNYDAANHLASVSQGASTITQYRYDAQGNRNSLTSGGATTAYGFDAENQLLDVSGVESYAYDAAGRRVLKTNTSNSPTTYYFYDQGGQLMYSYDPASLKATNYIYLGTKLIARHAVTNSQITGAVDGVDADSSGNAIVHGWACSTNLAQSINIDIYVGGPAGSGVYLGRYLANQSNETAVDTACGVSSGNYGYSVSISAATRYQYVGQPVYVYGISPVGNPNLAIAGSGAYNMPAINSQITGNIDAVSLDGSGNANIYGWACSTNIAQSINVDLYLGGPAGTGTFIGRYLANQSSEPGVATACNVSTGSYRFVIPLSTTTRAQYAGKLVYVHGISPVGNPNLLIGNSGVDAVPANPTAPAAPASVTATVAADLGSISATWASESGATSYNVQYRVNGGAWSQSSAVTGASYTLSGPGDGNYQFQVQACNAAGCSAWTSSATVGLWHPPTAAPALSSPGLSNNGGYAVSWTAVAAASSYGLQQQVNGGSWSTIQTNGATSWSASGEGDGTYSYRVQACNAGGCGPWSSTSTTTVEYPPSSAPSLSGGGTSNNGSYSLSWSGIATATSYPLQESVNGGGWATVQASGATSWSTGGRGNGSYQYHVQACNSGGCSPWSNVVTETVALIPPTPTLTVNQSTTSTMIILSATWTAEPNATSYTLQQEAGTTISQLYSGTGTSYSFGYARGALRSVRVQACSSAGCSAWSNWTQ